MSTAGQNPKKVLFVLTSHKDLGQTGKATGYHLAEATHPFAALTAAGIQVDFASPMGGKAPVDPNSLDMSDSINREFWNSPSLRKHLESTMKLADVKASDYDAIFFPGGHGPMWDMRQNSDVQRLVRSIYERGGAVGAVCHGPVALVDVTLTNGEPFVKGKTLNSFTDEEERKIGMDKVVPFLLETVLRERGANFRKSAPQQKHVEVDERLVTGQNPASATGVGEALAKVIKARR